MYPSQSARNAPGGQEYWVEHKGKVRQLLVGEPDEPSARALLLKKLPDADFLGRTSRGAQVMSLLHIEPTEIVEWVPIGSDKIDPKFAAIPMGKRAKGH